MQTPQTGLNILFSNRYMFRSYDPLQVEINSSSYTPEDGHKTETCSGYWIKYSKQCCVRRKRWTWPSTRNRMQTTNFKIISICHLDICPGWLRKSTQPASETSNSLFLLTLRHDRMTASPTLQVSHAPFDRIDNKNRDTNPSNLCLIWACETCCKSTGQEHSKHIAG
jgi:hypothetical protein